MIYARDTSVGVSCPGKQPHYFRKEYFPYFGDTADTFLDRGYDRSYRNYTSVPCTHVAYYLLLQFGIEIQSHHSSRESSLVDNFIEFDSFPPATLLKENAPLTTNANILDFWCLSGIGLTVQTG